MRESYHNPPAAQVQTWSPEPLSLVLPDRRSRDRRNYDNELEAHARSYENQGYAETEAWQAALTDLGDMEHWRWLRGQRNGRRAA